MSLPDRLRDPAFWPWAVVALLLFGGAGVAAFLLPPTLFAAMLAGGTVVLAWLVLPEAMILILLLVRASVDGFMELFTLFAGSPLSMNLSGAVNSMAVGLGMVTLGRRLVRKWQGEPQPLLGAAPAWSYALFLLVCLASIPGSLDPAFGVKEWARLASGLAIYLMVADTTHDERGARKFLIVILLSSLLPLIVALLQRLTGGGYFFLGFVGTQFAHRPQGTFAHPAALGSYLVILLTLGMAIYSSSRRLRSAMLLWAGVATTCLVLTLARTQWLGMMVAMLVVGLLKRRRLALVALVVALALLAAIPLLRERLVASESVGWRLDLWQAALNLAWPPTLLGRGLATSPWHISLFLPKVESPPHNDYLKAIIEMGLLGFLTYLFWLLALAWHAWRAYRRAKLPAITWRALALLAITIASAVMSLTDNYMGYTAVQWYLWALVALVPSSGHWPEAQTTQSFSA